jgi:SAM-dependent methyltransferase
MTTEIDIQNQQPGHWNGIAGHAWVDAQKILDEMFKPFEALLVEAVIAGAGVDVLDVGCGSGSTTLAAVQRLGSKGRCVGIDISEPMIAAARARVEHENTRADFIRADAQTYAFEPASFDTIISRFGVMFFDDSIAAFTNLRAAARDNAELRFIAWRSAEENSFMITAEHAAAPLLQKHPIQQTGQFALADQHRIRCILENSGWTDIDIQSIDVACSFPEQELVHYFTRLGPLGRILHETNQHTRQQIIETVREAIDSYVHGEEVRFNAACWLVSARSPSVSKEISNV